tara:strand:+ start:1280 stop:2095 length:816 start_codon:yes stop_codon:yes gene_type:complete
MIYLSKTHRSVTEKYIEFAHKGLPGSEILPYEQVLTKTDATKVWLFGLLRGTNLVYQHCVKNKIDFYYMDRPYWGISRQPPYFLRIVKNDHVKNFIDERPDDRFKATFPYEIKPYHKNGKKILVCPPTNSISTFFKSENWLENTLAELKKYTNREIIVREKPYNPEAQLGTDGKIHTGENSTKAPKDKINWSDIHSVVTNNSAITIKALASGVPVFADSNNCAFPIAGKSLAQIEQPVYEDPRPLFYSLAYGQFTEKEMSDGTAQRILDGR